MLSFLQKKYSEEDLILFNFLRRNRLFEHLTDSELTYLKPYLYLRKYHSDEVVFFTGDPSNGVYIVKSGLVTLNIEIRGDFEKLETLRSGRLFGDNAVLKGTKRLYTAIAMTDQSEIYVMPKANLIDVMNSHVEVKAKIMSAFAELYNEYTTNLFKTYKSSLGFFDLHTLYNGIDNL